MRQTAPHRLPWNGSRLAVAGLFLALLAACGGGGGGGGSDSGDLGSPASCSVADRNTWLRSYFDQWYFWYAMAPSPDPAGYASIDAYFDDLLYGGGDRIEGDSAGRTWPADEWSTLESTESFDRYYGDGKTLGYGVSLAGLEVTGMPNEPLYVRYVEPSSPAAAARIVRGDQVLEINGRPSAEIVADPDGFDVLTANSAGQALTLKLRNASGDRVVTVKADIFALTPVPPPRLFITPGGRKMGYVQINQMINPSGQTIAALDAALASFKSSGATDLVLDVRYNGGGLVSVANTIAGYVAGSKGAGRIFATLLYNDRRASANNQTYRFASPPPAASMSLSRVILLTGRRTCSATEQLVNGLRGVDIEVVAIGETTCGKPVGFLPRSDDCGTTYSVVNFESINALNQGRYFDGFDATCQVAEDWSRPLGDETEPLLATAIGRVDTGACPAAAMRERPLFRRLKSDRPEPGERQGMIP